MERIGWQGATRTRLLKERLGQGLAHWREGWGVEQWRQAGVEVECAEQCSRPAGERQCWLLESGDAAMWVEGPASIGPALASHALRVDGSPANALVHGVGKRCFFDLCSTLWGKDGAPSPVRSAPPGEREAASRHGGLGFRIAGIPENLTITVNRAWCQLHASTLPNEGRPSAMVERRVALGSTRIAITAAIELGEIQLLDSLEWKVGEILLADVPHDPKVILATPAGRIAKGSLCRGRSTRAVVLD